MSEHIGDERGAEVADVIDMAAARRRLGERAVGTAEAPPLPMFIDVKLGEDDVTLRAWIMAESPTAYYDALAYGKVTEATVVWGQIKTRRAVPNPATSGKFAVIFDHDALPDHAAMSLALQAVADHTGPDQRFDVNELYHQGGWDNVTLPGRPAYELAA